MDDIKREINKSKRSKTEHVKNTVTSYLQKRNYPSVTLQNITPMQQITYSLVENEVSRPNSILYSCYNSDPIAIDQNFAKFVSWLKELLRNNNNCHDLEYIIGPLFCHLYLDILKGGHSEPAATFFKAHLPSIDTTKCDNSVQELIKLIANENDTSNIIEQFRSNKYMLELSGESIKLLKKFVVENCHVVILHIFQTWFDIKETDDNESNMNSEEIKKCQDNKQTNSKFKQILEVIDELKKESKEVFTINITNTRELVTCGLIKRSCGLVVFNQNSVLHLRPIHSYDTILGLEEYKEIKFSSHLKQIYSVAISPNHCNLVSASADHNLCIYDLIDIKLMHTCTGHLGPVYCTAISSNNMYMASASQDTTARLWDITTGQTLRVFAGHTQAVTCVDFHSNCLYLATGSADRNIRLWSIDNAEPLRLFHGAKGTIYTIAFHPLGEYLASASDDKKVRIWDLLQSKIYIELKYKGDVITKLIWSKDGRELCTGAIDGIIRIWDFSKIQNNFNDLQCHEPIDSFNVNKKLLNLEFDFDTFACVTT